MDPHTKRRKAFCFAEVKEAIARVVANVWYKKQERKIVQEILNETKNAGKAEVKLLDE